MEDYPEAEEITRLSIFCIFVSQIHDLRSNKSWSSTPSKDVIFRMHVFGEPEISNNTLAGLLISDEYIFWLYVPMHNILLMHGF